MEGRKGFKRCEVISIQSLEQLLGIQGSKKNYVNKKINKKKFTPNLCLPGQRSDSTTFHILIKLNFLFVNSNCLYTENSRT